MMIRTTCTTEELHEVFSDVATAAHMARQYLIAYQQMLDRLSALQHSYDAQSWREDLLRYLTAPPLALSPRHATAVLDALGQASASPEVLLNLARWAEAQSPQHR